MGYGEFFKMKNTIVSGFYIDILKDSIKELEKNKYINICKWIVGENDTKVEHNNIIWWWDIVYKEKYDNKVVLSDNELEYLMQYYHVFEQHLAREKIFELYSNYEVKNIIFKFIYYFKNLIVKNNVDLVLFSDVPHGAYDLILYYIAKLYNIKTIFLMSSFWPGHTFIYEDLNDIGKYDNKINEKLKLEQTFKKNLPYMNKETFNQKMKRKAKILWNTKKYLQNKKNDFINNKIIYKNLSNYVLMHIERETKRLREKRIFFTKYKDYFCDKIRENEKFVYFPLHLQPEMTTDTLGGIYYDQLFAIEKLRKILPDDWMIYIKENPKQTYYMRGEQFFERLKSITNIRLLSKEVDTYKIMEKCQFVATITGTAGWEAITGGKQALVFGLAWYRYLPGVTIYSDNTTVEEILGKSIDYDKLCTSAYNLKLTTSLFVNDEYYKNLIENFNIDENNNKIFNVLKEKI